MGPGGCGGTRSFKAGKIRAVNGCSGFAEEEGWGVYMCGGDFSTPSHIMRLISEPLISPPSR